MDWRWTSDGGQSNSDLGRSRQSNPWSVGHALRGSWSVDGRSIEDQSLVQLPGPSGGPCIPVEGPGAHAAKLPSNRVHLIQITTQDTAGHPWPTSLLSSPDLSDLCDDASRLAPPLMAHQPTAGSPFPYSPWDPPPLRRPCSRRLTSRSLTSSLPLYLI